MYSPNIGFLGRVQEPTSNHRVSEGSFKFWVNSPNYRDQMQLGQYSQQATGTHGMILSLAMSWLQGRCPVGEIMSPERVRCPQLMTLWTRSPAAALPLSHLLGICLLFLLFLLQRYRPFLLYFGQRRVPRQNSDNLSVIHNSYRESLRATRQELKHF